MAAQRAAGADPLLRAVIMSVQAPTLAEDGAGQGTAAKEADKARAPGPLSGLGPVRSPPSLLAASSVASVPSLAADYSQSDMRRMLLRGPQFAGKAKLTFRDCIAAD